MSAAAAPALVPYNDDSGRPSSEACASAACRAKAPATHMCARCRRGAFCNEACLGASAHALVCVPDDSDDADDADDGADGTDDAMEDEDVFAETFKTAVNANKPKMRALLRAVGRQGLWDLVCGQEINVVATRGAAMALLPDDAGASFGALPAPVSPMVLAAYPEFARAIHAVAASPAKAGETPAGFKISGASYAGETFTLEVARLKSKRLRATLCLTSED